MRKAFTGRNVGLLRFIGTFLFFFAAVLIFCRFSLPTPYMHDDLHLIRTYSVDELRGVWTGTWDPDGIETVGFRPFTIYFYQSLAYLFDSSVVGQRLFLLGLFALLLTLLGVLVYRLFDCSYRVILLGGLLGLLHIANVSHYSWITDGVYLVSGLFVVGAIGFVLRFVKTENGWWLLVSGLCVVAALLVREDSLVVCPLLGLFLCAALLRERIRLSPPRDPFVSPSWRTAQLSVQS